MVCASLLKGPSCISSRKFSVNCGSPSFMPINVATDATLCRIMLRVTSYTAKQTSSMLILTHVESLSANASLCPSELFSSSSSSPPIPYMACPFLKMNPLMIKNTQRRCSQQVRTGFTPKASQKPPRASSCWGEKHLAASITLRQLYNRVILQSRVATFVSLLQSTINTRSSSTIRSACRTPAFRQYTLRWLTTVTTFRQNNKATENELAVSRARFSRALISSSGLSFFLMSKAFRCSSKQVVASSSDPLMLFQNAALWKCALSTVFSTSLLSCFSWEGSASATLLISKTKCSILTSSNLTTSSPALHPRSSYKQRSFRSSIQPARYFLPKAFPIQSRAMTVKYMACWRGSEGDVICGSWPLSLEKASCWSSSRVI